MMFMELKMQYYEDVNYPQTDLQMQYGPNQNPSQNLVEMDRLKIHMTPEYIKCTNNSTIK